MKAVRRVFAFLVTLVLVLGCAPTTHAADNQAQHAAEYLYSIGLFLGTGTDVSGKPIFELDRSPTRAEAVTMLVRLLGKTAEATDGDWSSPFTDVPEWAVPYVGYAYAEGLTMGISATKFGSNSPSTASMYITFVLRALGYSSSSDFRWDAAWELSDRLGITDGRFRADSAFTRGGVAIISDSALETKYKGRDCTLLETLVSDGALTRIQDPRKSIVRIEISSQVYPNSSYYDEEYQMTFTGYERAIISAYNIYGDLVWSYKTPEAIWTEMPAFGVLGRKGFNYYFVEGTSVVCLDVKTGAVLWKNKDYAGRASGFAFGENVLYLCGQYGPDFYAISYDGKTLVRIQEFDSKYYWASKVELINGTAAVYLYGGTEDYDKPIICYVDLKTFEYSFH